MTDAPQTQGFQVTSDFLDHTYLSPTLQLQIYSQRVKRYGKRACPFAAQGSPPPGCTSVVMLMVAKGARGKAISRRKTPVPGDNFTLSFHRPTETP